MNLMLFGSGIRLYRNPWESSKMASRFGKVEMNSAVSLIDLSRIFRSLVSLRKVRWLQTKRQSVQTECIDQAKEIDTYVTCDRAAIPNCLLIKCTLREVLKSTHVKIPLVVAWRNDLETKDNLLE